jgi:hypothetical protein
VTHQLDIWQKHTNTHTNIKKKKLKRRRRKKNGEGAINTTKKVGI